MDYDRTVAASMESTSLTLVDDPLLELLCPANMIIEVIRVEIGPAEAAAPIDEIQPIALWMGTVVGSGGGAITERIVTGSGTIGGVAVSNVTTIGTGNEFYHTAYHTQNGWLYLPVPEERPRLVSGGDDVFAAVFPTAPQVAIVTSCTIVWGEVG